MPKHPKIQIKRAYDPTAVGDGRRFLVDHLWPRGVTKVKLKVESWLRSVSPSDKLRKWFNHDPARWDGFQQRYHAELDKKPATWQPLLDAAKSGNITLVFGARDIQHNNAIALKVYLEKKIR
ncbi:MAG TPA: DUF488 family protein [Phycisphaerae bacterium]|nr:DUF488 family protein [Phycisphaerae bacterium]